MNVPVQPLLSTSVDAPQWNASLQIIARKTARGTRLVQSEHIGPLYVQKPFYPEGPDCAHIYLLHPPGGMVSGDTLAINVTSSAGAGTLVTTPGAGRVYRARPDRLLQKQLVNLTVEAGSSLEWMPLETILFPSSRAQLETRVDLHGDARFIGWEITSLGLPANRQTLNHDGADTTLKQGLRIYKDGRLLLNERLNLHPDNMELLTARAGFKGQPVHGLMVAGPFSQPIDEDIMARLQALCDDTLAGVSLNGAFLTLRTLTDCSERARHLLTKAWAEIRPVLLDRPACPPRIWAT